MAHTHAEGQADDHATGIALPVRREQAGERGHKVDAAVVIDRLGQRRRPHIVTLTAKWTFEEGLLALFVSLRAAGQAAVPFDAE